MKVVIGSGEAVNEVDQVGVERFEELAKHLENKEKVLTHGVQVIGEAAFAEHRQEIAAGIETVRCPLSVAVKVQSGHARDRHNLGIAHLAVRVFGMIKGFQHVIIATIKSYDVIASGIASIIEPGLKEDSLEVLFAVSNG